MESHRDILLEVQPEAESGWKAVLITAYTFSMISSEKENESSEKQYALDCVAGGIWTCVYTTKIPRSFHYNVMCAILEF